MRRDQDWTRRDFLGVLVGATGSLLIVGCSPSDTATTTSTVPVSTLAPSAGTTTTTLPPPAPSTYWDVLRETQRRVRTSPDHLPAHLSRLAGAGDIDGLVAVLRDHIAVLPVDPSAWVSNTTGQRWGTRGVLRSGMGTPREIAQLLADTLNEAGIEATVVRGSTQGSERPVLVPVGPLPFETDLPTDELFVLTGASPVPAERTVDPALGIAMATAALSAIEPGVFRPPVTAELFGALPDVLIGDATAGLWNESLGLRSVENRPAPLGAMAAAQTARFTVSIATDLDPANPAEVATAEFPLDALAGRRVDIAFVPPAASLADLIATRPADVTTVIPTIRVGGLDLTEDEESTLFAAGEPFTLEGDVLTDDGDGFSLGAARIAGSGDPAAAAEIRINRIVATHYPKLTAEIDVLDGEGRTVPDLGAQHFLIDDVGFDVPFSMRRTDRPTPSIVFVVDNSGSVPEQYRNAGATKVVTEIATAVQAQYPDARFRAAIVGIFGAGLPLPWTDDPVQVGIDADKLGIGSALWQSYIDGAVPDANALVFLTDGVSVDDMNNPQDTAPEELITALRSGPPAIMLGSGELGPAFRGIADITGGVALDIEDAEAAVAAVLEQLDRTLTPYSTMILADEANNATQRTLRVRLPEVGLEASATYDVPRPEESSIGRSLAGIYLRIEANGIRVDRTLAGLPYRSREELTSDVAAEVRQALFGRYSVITEAGGPAPSQILDDAVTELLTWEPVFEAQSADAALEALAAAEDLPHGSFAFSFPVSGDGPLTWEPGLRMWISSERTIPRGDVDIVRRSVDLLPVTRFVTTTIEDPIESVRLTAERSASLSAMEAALYDASAAGDLTGDLTELSLGSVASEDRAAFDALSNGWPGSWRLAFNDDRDAAVAVDPLNGTVIAVANDGTGGATSEEEIKRAFKQAIALTELYGTAGFKVWASLEKAKLEKLRFATLVIHRMSVEGILETIAEEACRKLKKTATGWAIGAIGAVSEEVAGMINFYIDKAKEVKRLGDAAGLAPSIPTAFPVC